MQKRRWAGCWSHCCCDQSTEGELGVTCPTAVMWSGACRFNDHEQKKWFVAALLCCSEERDTRLHLPQEGEQKNASTENLQTFVGRQAFDICLRSVLAWLIGSAFPNFRLVAVFSSEELPECARNCFASEDTDGDSATCLRTQRDFAPQIWLGGVSPIYSEACGFLWESTFWHLQSCIIIRTDNTGPSLCSPCRY